MQSPQGIVQESGGIVVRHEDDLAVCWLAYQQAGTTMVGQEKDIGPKPVDLTS
jgi:hypothetical protein